MRALPPWEFVEKNPKRRALEKKDRLRVLRGSLRRSSLKQLRSSHWKSFGQSRDSEIFSKPSRTCSETGHFHMSAA